MQYPLQIWCMLLVASVPMALAQDVRPQLYEARPSGINAPGLIGEGDPLESLAGEALDSASPSGARPVPDLLELDLDNDGRVAIAEWRSWMRRHRYAPLMGIALSEIDDDGDGIISQEEYALHTQGAPLLDELGPEVVAPATSGAIVEDTPGWNWGVQQD